MMELTMYECMLDARMSQTASIDDNHGVDLGACVGRKSMLHERRSASTTETLPVVQERL